MYRQRPFAIDDVDWCRGLARAHAFATVVASAVGHEVGPARVAHIPVLVEADGSLAFHVASDNPVAELSVGDAVLAVFHGPHALVSATWYVEPDKQVPTWDYEAVHATGRVVEVMTSGPAREHVADVATTFEGPDGWSVEDAPATTDQLLPALTAFRVEVDRWEGVAKLSQNKSDEDRLRVGVNLRQSRDPVARLVGERVLEELGDVAGAAPMPSSAPTGGDAIRLADFELRLPTEDDRDLLLAASQRSAAMYAHGGGPPMDVEAFEDWLARIRPDQHHRCLAFHRGDLLGIVSLQNIVRGPGQYTTLGYSAFAPFEGHGLMRRAVALGVDLALGELELHRAEAGIQPSNVRSLAVVRALGFRYEGLLKRLVKANGEYRDHELWATDTEDWPGAAAIFD